MQYLISPLAVLLSRYIQWSETLDKVIEQGLDEENLKHKDELVNFFMGITDKIRIGDLFVTLTSYDYTNNNRQQYAKFSLCQGFVNIHFFNCNDVLLCIEHLYK